MVSRMNHVIVLLYLVNDCPFENFASITGLQEMAWCTLGYALFEVYVAVFACNINKPINHEDKLHSWYLD